MCKQILILTLSMLYGQAFAAWTITPYVSGGDGTFYWDTQKITYKGDGFKIGTAIDFGEMQFSKLKPEQKYLSVQEELELNCVKFQARVLTYAEYSDHLGFGSVVAQSPHETQWSAVESDTFSYHVMKTFCSKRNTNP